MQNQTQATIAAHDGGARDQYVDVAKGLCMLLVVCIHTEVFGVVGMPLTFIAVPMFFFLSGFYDHSERPFSAWLRKAATTLLLPGTVWLAIGIAYVALLSVAGHGSYAFANTLYEPFAGNGAVWFLFALFYAKVALGLLLRLKLPTWLLSTICIGGGYCGMAFQMPLCLDEGLAALPLLLAGKLLRPHLKKAAVRVVATVAGLGSLAAFLCGQLSFTIVPVSNGNFHPFYLLALVGIVLVFAPVLECSRLLERCRWLASFGRHSLGIMLCHMMMCHTAAVTLKRVFAEGSTAWIIAFLVAYALICLAAYWLTVFVERHCPMLLGKTRR